MSIEKIASSVDIAVSGLRAESLRMNVISNNIANANTVTTGTGEPYRRQEVIFSTLMDQLSGVTIDEVISDQGEFKQVYEPGHPFAGESGYVRMPNVDLPVEMMQLVHASRAYEANAAVLKRYQEMVNTTLELLR